MIQLTSLQWPADQGHHRCWAWGSHFSAPPPPPTHVLDCTLFLPLGFLAPFRLAAGASG